MDSNRPAPLAPCVTYVTLAPCGVGSVASFNPASVGSSVTQTGAAKTESKMSDFVSKALDALNAMSTAAAIGEDATHQRGSYRQEFAKACLEAAAIGTGGLDDVKAAFDAMPKAVKDRVKGAVNETLGVIRYVVSGNIIPAREDKKGNLVHPEARTLACLIASTAAISSYVPAWREAKAAVGAATGEVERNRQRMLALGINALGLANGANVPDALAAFAKGDTYHGHTEAALHEAGEIVAADNEVAAKAKAAADEREVFRAKVLDYLRGCTPDELTAIMDDVTAADVAKAA